MDNGAWQQELARRKRVQTRISWAAMSSNACGIVLTLLYFILTEAEGAQPLQNVAVLLAETTAKAAGDLAAFTAVGTVEVRGKQAPVAVYTL